MSKTSETMQRDVDQLSGLFRLLSDKTRLHIVLLLTDGERNVGSLCEQLQLPQPTVSHHLGLLRTQNIIANRRNGKQVYYGLNEDVNVHHDESAIKIGVDNFSVSIAAKVM